MTSLPFDAQELRGWLERILAQVITVDGKSFTVLQFFMQPELRGVCRFVTPSLPLFGVRIVFVEQTLKERTISWMFSWCFLVFLWVALLGWVCVTFRGRSLTTCLTTTHAQVLRRGRQTPHGGRGHGIWRSRVYCPNGREWQDQGAASPRPNCLHQLSHFPLLLRSSSFPLERHLLRAVLLERRLLEVDVFPQLL